MKKDILDQQISALQQRMDELQQQASTSPLSSEYVENVLEELKIALEELNVASEELQQQNEELIASQQALEAERRRYHDLFDFAPDGYLVTDVQGTIQEANRAAAGLLSVRQDFLVGKPLPIFVVEPDRDTMRTKTVQVDQVQKWEVQLQPRGGTPFPAMLTVAPVRDAQGTLIGLRWLLRDITERKRAEEEMQARMRQQTVVADLGQRALAGLDLSQLMKETVALVAHTLDVEYCKVLELLPDGTALRLQAGVGWKEGAVGQAIVEAGTDSQAGYTLLSSEPVIVQDLRTETRFSGPPLLHDHGVISGLSVIIHGRNRPFGVLGVHTTQQRTFTREHVHFLQTIAHILALAIERKRVEAKLEALNTLLEQRVAERAGFIQLLQKVAVAANEALTIEEAIQFALDQVCAHIGWPVGHAYLPVKSAKDALAPATLWHLDNPKQLEEFREMTEHSRFAPGVGLPGQVLASGKPVWMRDVTTHPHFLRGELAQNLGVKSGFAFPVMIGTEVVAVLEFFSPEAQEANEPLLDAMMSIGTQLGRMVERKWAEETLREREERFRKIFEEGPLGMAIVSRDYHFLRVNTALCRMIGYTEQELTARTFLDITHPEDMENDIQLAEQIRSGELLRAKKEKRYLTKNKEVLWASLTIAPIQDVEGKYLYNLSMIEDITERKQAEESLRQSQRFLQSTLDALSAHIAILDDSGTIIAVNTAWKRFAKIHGFEGEHHGVGMNYLEICDAATGEGLEVAHAAAQSIREVMTNQRPDFYLEYPCSQPAEKEDLWFQLRVTRFEGPGSVRVVVAHENITELKQLEQQLIKSERLAYIGELAGGLAHEIKNPLSSLSTAASLLTDDAGTVIGEEQVTLLHVIQRETEQLNHILSDFLHFASPRQPHLELCNINVLCEQTLESLQYDQTATGKEVRKALDPQLHPLLVDANQMQQVLWNIMLNAFQAMDEGGILTLSSVQQGNEVLLMIQDTGPGIPPGVMENIFEPFYSRKKGGSGLGLAIARRVVEVHGGYIAVDTEEHKGTIFTIALPVERGDI